MVDYSEHCESIKEQLTRAFPDYTWEVYQHDEEYTHFELGTEEDDGGAVEVTHRDLGSELGFENHQEWFVRGRSLPYGKTARKTYVHKNDNLPSEAVEMLSRII